MQQHVPVWRHATRAVRSHGNWNATSWSCKPKKRINELYNFSRVFILQTIVGDSGPEGATVYHLDGGSESFVNFSSELTVEPSQGFTIACWIYQETENDG